MWNVTMDTPFITFIGYFYVNASKKIILIKKILCTILYSNSRIYMFNIKLLS